MDQTISELKYYISAKILTSQKLQEVRE